MKTIGAEEWTLTTRRCIILEMRDACLIHRAGTRVQDGLPVLSFLFRKGVRFKETFVHPTAEWPSV
jgi:hypothetical protein